MPTDLLQACRRYVAKNYRSRLGTTLSESLRDLHDAKVPVWQFVNANDLTTKADPKTATNAGLLLDPEIGLMCYFLPFSRKTELRRQISRALKLRSRLSVNNTGTEDCDEFGAWRVAAIWLVDGARLKESWIQQITGVRRETAFSEEISFDAIFLNGEIDEDLETHGLPRLLLTTREVLRKQRREEITRWRSADAKVEEALSDFATAFAHQEQRDLATEVTKALCEFQAKPSREGFELEGEPVTLQSIRVQEFRNLRDVHLEFGLQPVSAHIIHGPNGTGKTSLCEAISIALFGSSQRYKAFADREQERDVNGTNRAAAYVDQYLTPLDSPDSEPKIALNGAEPQRPTLVDLDGIADADLAMGGTVLMQGASQEFSRLSSHQLGARILRGYSELADQIEEFTESRFIQSGAARQEFLRGLGLSAAITKLDTAYERLSRRVIDKSLPAMPHQLVSWMEGLMATRFASGASDLSSKWRLWGSEESRFSISAELAATTSSASIQQLLRHWLDRYSHLVIATEEFLADIGEKVSSRREELDRAANLISSWGQWLDHPASRPTTTSPKAEKLARESKELELESQRILTLGQETKAHLDHLTQAQTFLQQTWLLHHENECPTCGADHAQDGGIARVLQALQSKVSGERERLLRLFNESKSRLTDVQKSLGQLGQPECPVKIEEQNQLGQLLQWLTPEEHSLSRCVADVDLRKDLLKAIELVAQKPLPPGKVHAENEAQRVAELLVSQFDHARRVFEAPNNWKPVKERLTQILATIVRDHLPRTLAGLWCELAMALTAAPWLLPAIPCIGVTTRRGERKSTVQVQNRLARYIFNQAEVQTLGLAWFFTRYLTDGRFSHACIVLDDPAQELDQTSFRDLCRLWETWIRLHRVYERPLRFLIMLNQESRALDAARATGGLLAVLGWSREQAESVQTVNLREEHFCPPRPVELFQAAVS